MALVTLAICGCDQQPAFRERTVGTEEEEPLAEKVPDDADQVARAVVPPTEGEGDSPRPNLVEMSWPTHEVTPMEMRLTPGSPWIEQTLEMERRHYDKTKSFVQSERPGLEQQWRQGEPGDNREQVFYQTAARQLDILLVIDNSVSMREEQAELAGRLLPLLESVEDIAWQIAVVTTDPRDACLRGLIRAGDGDARQAFARAVRAGTGGSNNEQGLASAVRALRGDCAAGSWLRPASSLAVLLVSDEDNCSDGTGCIGSPWARAGDFLEFLAGIREPGVDARVHGLFWQPDAGGSCPTARNPAPIYQELVQRTGGTAGSICDSDYTGTLAGISLGMRRTLDRSFSLEKVPDAGSVQVRVDGEAVYAWNLHGRVVEFAEPPPDGAEVRIAYAHSIRPLLRVFPLDRQGAADSYTVLVDGQSWPEDAAWIGPEGRRLIFSGPPPAGSEIRLHYRAPGQTDRQFELEETLLPDSLMVVINGRPATDGFTVEAGTGTVYFDPPPADGASLEFRYRVPGEPVVHYPVFAGAGQVPEILTAVDPDSGRPLDVTLENNMLRFGNEDFREGRRILVRYRNPGHSAAVALSGKVLENSLQVQYGDTPCAAGQLLIRGERNDGQPVTFVDWSGCGFTGNGELLLRWQRVDHIRRHFTFEEFPEGVTGGTWQVLVNGEGYAFWERQGLDFYLSGDWSPGSGVTIRYIY